MNTDNKFGLTGSEIGSLLREWCTSVFPPKKIASAVANKPANDEWEVFVEQHKSKLSAELLRMSKLPTKDDTIAAFDAWDDDLIMVFASRFSHRVQIVETALSDTVLISGETMAGASRLDLARIAIQLYLVPESLEEFPSHPQPSHAH